MKPNGRLELTWANKDLRLLAHDDQSFTWVDRADFRISEVRLLREVETVGEPSDNLLIRGDALNALTALTHLPGYRERYAGKVKLCYIDPPFNTGQAFANYDDALENSAWLTFMRDRFEQIRDLLAPDGSIWVHLDDAQQHRARTVLDEVFGSDSFVATVVWQKRTSRENRAAIGSSHDYIHVYAPAGAARWAQTRNRLPSSGGGYANPDHDPRGPWRSIPMSAQAGHATPSQFYAITTPTGAVLDPPRGRAWTLTKPRFEEVLSEGRVYFPRGGDGRPRLKRFPSEDEGLVPTTWWPASEVGGTDESKKEILSLYPGIAPFETPKPERLMERIITIATNPGDWVLDCFAGSGTTAAVAHKMDRRWITVESVGETVRAYARPRLERVVQGDDSGGITEALSWGGGGGFRLMEVAPSMFEEADGTVVLAEWATGGALAEAVAAQFGYLFEPQAPFAGRRGRSRLAVIDGVLSPEVVRYLAQRLAPGEGLLIVAEAIEAGAAELARSLVRGAKVRKVPRDLARVGHQLTLRVGLAADQAEVRS